MNLQPEFKNIYFAKQALQQLGKLLRETKPSPVMVLCDRNTQKHCWPLLQEALPELRPLRPVTVPPGEESKSLASLDELWQAMGQMCLDRNSLLLNLGGGVITDLGGMAASTYLRGISYVQMPTSLLAMADASVGGKTGINYHGAKNQIGTFSRPAMVGILPQFLDTVPPEEKKSGAAEMLKHGLIRREDHFWKIIARLQNESQPSAKELETTIQIKAAIVDDDRYEQGARAVLNFGHTVGHALESALAGTERSLSHGRAVALGMLVALRLSVQRAQLREADGRQVYTALAREYIWPPGPMPDWEELFPLMRKDKKNKAGRLRMVLLRELGVAVADQEVTEVELREALENSWGRAAW